jgi:hypothetical protein
MKRFISLLNIVLVLGLLVAGCAPPTPEVIVKEVPVEELVVLTAAVEKVVEETAMVEEEQPVEVVKEVPVIDFSTDLDEQNEPIGGASSFPEQVEKICGSFMPSGEVDIQLLGMYGPTGYMTERGWELEFASASPSGRIGFCFNAHELPPGEHALEVHDTDGDLIASGRLEIEE